MHIREFLAFFAIYVIWGSTYLAIRHAVETIPPLMTAGVRHLIAGLVLYAWVRHSDVRVSRTEWRASLVVAALFFLIGHGTLHWAEQTVPSGIAALLVATEPLWIAMLMPPAQGSRVGVRLLLGLAAGLAGVGLLMPAETLAAQPAYLWGSSAILLGAMSWALGVRYSATAPLPGDPFVRTATTLLSGAVLLLTASLATGEAARLDLRAISARSLVGLGYLIVFGSLVAFSAYIWLLERCSATLVATTPM
jgi:drug/metabolite transporter (DMT)-like permease